MPFGNALYGFILLVIPAQAGIQFRIYLMKIRLDTGFRRYDVGGSNFRKVLGPRFTGNGFYGRRGGSFFS
jgi:hypothetical protein